MGLLGWFGFGPLARTIRNSAVGRPSRLAASSRWAPHLPGNTPKPRWSRPPTGAWFPPHYDLGATRPETPAEAAEPGRPGRRVSSLLSAPHPPQITALPPTICTEPTPNTALKIMAGNRPPHGPGAHHTPRSPHSAFILTARQKHRVPDP